MKRGLTVFIFSLLLGGGLGHAQETTGAILGRATDQEGGTLPGLTVTINDGETGLERTTVTNAGGEFKFVALPPARYDLTATLDGFQTFRRSLQVALGRTVKSDFTMELGAITDVIEVTGEAPLVDVTSTVSGLTVSADDLNARLPVVREATQVALLAPSTVQGDSSFSSGNMDRGYTPGQNMVAIGGASVAENAYQVNGLNITNFRKGIGASLVPFEFMEELQVKTGGYEAEFGRSTGGVINMITKSGGNSFHGGASVYYEPESWQEQSPDTYLALNSLEDTELLEFNASLGGAIVRDRLFFFLFGTYMDGSRTVMDTTRGQFWTLAEPYWGGKVDWNITSNHRLEGTYFSDGVTVDTRLRPYSPEAGFGPVDQTGVNDRGGENWILKYTGIFTENFMLAAQYGSNAFDRRSVSTADLTCPSAYDSRDGGLTALGCWVNFTPAVEALDEREAYRLDLDWYIGNHSLRGGIDYEDNWSSELSGYSAGVYYRYYLNGEDYPQIPPDQEIVRVRELSNGGSFQALSESFYVQDSWAVTPGLTLNLGVRNEAFDNRNASGETFIKIDNQWAPRLGAIWDPRGDGRSKLYGSYGQYHLPIPSNTNVRMAGLEFFTEGFYTFSGGIDADGSPGALEDELESRVISNGEIPDVRTVRDDNIDPMYQEELVLGYEHMLGANWSVGARFVGREFGEVIEDITLDKALGLYMSDTELGDCFNPESVWWGTCQHEYRLTNPGTGFSGYADLDFDGVPDPISFTAQQLEYPRGKRQYYAIELIFKRRFADNWMLQGAYSWSQSYGNYEGYVNSDLGQDDPGITESFDHAGLMEYGDGYLPNDRRHNLKLFGAYAWDFGFQLGANMWYMTGRPLNGFGVHPTDPWAATYDNYAFFNGGEPCPRGCGGETDDSWAFDLSAKYDFVTGAVNWNIRLDVFNLTNEQTATEINDFAEQTTGNPNPNYLVNTGYQTPRRVRLGFGVNF